MFDAVQIEKRGIPTVTIIHESFSSAARIHAKMMGMPHLPLVIEPDPESEMFGHDAEAVADETMPVVLAALLRGGAGGHGDG